MKFSPNQLVSQGLGSRCLLALMWLGRMLTILNEKILSNVKAAVCYSLQKNPNASLPFLRHPVEDSQVSSTIPPPAQVVTSTLFAVLCLRHWVFLGKLIPQNTSRLFQCRGPILQLTDVAPSTWSSEDHLVCFLTSFIQFHPLLQELYFIPLARSSVEEPFSLCRRISSISWKNRFDSMTLESQHLIRQSCCQHVIRQSF